MGISFKVSRTGKRVHPKPLPPDAASFPVKDQESDDAVIASSKKKTDTNSLSTPKPVGQTSDNKSVVEISDNEVSFTLSLFPDGYSIAKPIENEPGRQISVEIPKFLHPYDRASETLFSAIESGRLPGDILDDIPCKYMDGTLVCEVRDYRKCSSEGLNVASGDSSPIINRVCLKMSLENIVKDIPAISESGWTYGDLMEVESRILKALQPKLCLDPTPQLDKLTNNPVSTKLNLDLRGMRRKKLRQIQEVSVLSNNIHGKKVYLDRVPESSRMGDLGSMVQQPSYDNLNPQNNVSSTMLPLRNNSFGSDVSLMASSALVAHQSKFQVGIGSPRIMKDQRTGSLLNVSVASPIGQDMMIPFSDDGSASIHGKRENQDSQSSPLTNKKARLMHTGGDGSLQNTGPQIDSLHGSELHWKNTLLQQQQSIGRGIQYANNNGMQKFPQQVFDEVGPNQMHTIGQQGIRYNLKEEPVESERLMGESSEFTNIDPRLQQRVPHHQFARSSFPQTTWNNLGQPLDNSNNNTRKEDSFQKRKLVQSPHVSSAGGLPQSPLSSKSGELSSGSIGHQFGAVANSGFVPSQKEKSAVTSVPSAGMNDSMQQRQNQAHAAAKRRSNSLPKTPGLLSGVGSPASVGNMSIPINANSPPVGTQPLGDQTVLDRFSKIEIVAVRFQLNCKKNKSDEYPIRKANAYSTQQLASHLSTDLNNENLKDETCKLPLSTSMIGGNMNVCKVRILNFIQTERIIQGNSFQLVPKGRTRMIMSEKPTDGAVAFYIGEIEDAEYLTVEDYLPTLPNTHTADLLAAQFSSLMVHEGHHLEADQLQPKPVRMNATSAALPSTSDMQQQFPEGVSVQLPNDITKPNNNNNNNNGNAPTNSPLNIQGPRMLSSQAIQMSSRPEQMPPQHPQFQRPMMLPSNSMQHLNNIAQSGNMQLGPHMTNKPSPLQLQILQQQQHQQRKMMPGLGNVGMGSGVGSIGNSNNMVGLGVLGGVMGIGGGGGGVGGRGMGGGGISAPMGSVISSMGNMSNQNAMNLSAASNISNAIRTGNLSAAQAAYMKMRNGQNRASNVLGGPQSSIGARQMHPVSSGPSMLGPALSRANMSPMQRTAMGPPKLMSGMNLYMNQQQQQHLQQQMQQQMQQLQQQQQENVLSPPQVSSPSSMGIPHQMNQQQLQQQQASPQQRTPMSPQLSSGAIHSMGGANQEACPASPQLSSQTMGSVGSIEMQQGVSKSNSVNNP